MCEIIDPVMELQSNVVWNGFDPSLTESPRLNPEVASYEKMRNWRVF